MAAYFLHALFSPGMLLRDSDSDGIADGVAASLEVAGDLQSWAGAVDLAARLGLESTGLTLPLVGGRGEFLVRIGPGLPLPGGLTLPETGLGLVAAGPGRTLTVTGADGSGARLAAQYLAARYPYLNRVGHGEAVVPEGATAILVGKAGAIACRVDGSWQELSACGESSGDQAVASAPAPDWRPLASLDQLFVDRDAVTIRLTPELTLEENSALVDLAARFGVEASSLRFPVALLPGETGDPGLAVSVVPSGGDPRITLTEAGISACGVAALNWLATTPVLTVLRTAQWSAAPPPEEEPFTELVYGGEWEVDRFWRVWREAVLPTLDPGRPAVVDLRLSEPAAVRQRIREDLLAALPTGSAVHVRSCFKQGLHWIMEEVIPELKRVGPVARIQLQFRRFTGKAPAGEQMLEMPIRWLQECYPADSLLALEVSLKESDVAFAMAEEGPTYRLTAYNAEDEPVLEMTYEADTGLRRYLDAFPDRGWVHPPTGSLTVNGRSFGPIPTDAECFWDWYQATVLAAVRDLVTGQFGEKPDPGAQPFFGTLRLAVRMSEEDRRLGIREEHISPLDALHEDLYFVTLDYMATWGRAIHDKPFGAPGMILPLVSGGEGRAPEARVTLTRRRPAAPVSDPAPVVGVTFGSDGSVAVVELAGGRTVTVPAPDLTPLDEADPVGDILLHEVIGPDQLPGGLAYLRTLPGIRVWQAGVSYLGRPCYALEVRLPVPEQIVPAAKSSAFKPVLLINARHHANEVSSTNAALKLAQRAALGDPELSAFLRRVTVVINPLENMDGAATHFALMAEHPTWKFHAARFNAVGLEYYGQYTDPRTPYTEARVLQELFRQYLPDILLDDHGVPSHEWLQPFAGCSSAPYFRVSYWLPNALLYGIFRVLDREHHPHQVAATEALRAVLTRRVQTAPELYRWNQRWLEIYRKWGTDWVPEKFPVELHEGMICYTWTAGPHAFSARYSDTCVVDWVTEVPDETAQGDHLRLTAEAHITAHLACLEFLAAHDQPVERTAVEDGGAIRWRVGRRRPFVVVRM